MAIQYDKIEEIKEKWGNKPCSHPNLEKEYYFSAQTGEYVCTQCGEVFTKEEKDKLVEKENCKQYSH